VYTIPPRSPHPHHSRTARAAFARASAPRCGTENPEGNKFCGECAAPLAEVAAAREVRKTVTVIFCDVTGSTALGESLDPESLRALLARYFERMRGIVEAHGGTVEKFIGDAVMAVFGVPRLHEDDALRAVRAAAEMRDALPELGVRGRLGLATGEVVTGTEERLATGDAVNVAARLEQAAEPGEILLGAETLALVRGAIEVEPVGGLAVKGKSEPVLAWRLLGLLPEAERRGSGSPLVGRERPLGLLENVFTGVRDDRACHLVTILGAAGVGKSRLVAEFLADSEGRVVRGRCLSYGEGVTYWPGVEIVKQLPTRPDDPEAASAVAALLRESDAGATPTEIAWAVRKTLEQEALAGPVVCVFDDIQWGEPGLLDLIEHVADYSRDAPIMLICIARPELLDRRSGWAGGKLNTSTILLEPLSPEQTDQVIDGLAPVDAELRERIRDAAEGNPLFVEEMLAMVHDSGDREVVVPPTIHALLGARLDQLDGSERAVLERGAAEGKVFHRGAVEALAPDEQRVSERLMALVRKELVRPDRTQIPGDDAFRFRHLLIRDAAYDALPKAVRADLHERFATWLEEHGGDLVELDEIVGYHFEQACRYRRELSGPGEAETLARAARSRLLTARRQARLLGEGRSSLNLVERAAALRSPKMLELELEVELADARFYVGDAAGALAAARALVETARRLDHRVGELCGLIVESVVITHTSHEAGAGPLEALLGEALPIFTEIGNDFALFVAYRALGEVANTRGRADEWLAACNAAVERATRLGRRDLVNELLGYLGPARLFGSTTVSELLAWLDEQERDHPEHAFNRGIRAAGLAMLGRFEEAREQFAAAAARSLDRGATVSYALITSHLGAEAELLAQEPARALELSLAGCRVLEERGEEAWLSTAVGHQAEALYALGRLDEADAQTLRAAELGAEDDLVTQIRWRQIQAKVLARRGDYPAAVGLAKEAVALADRTDYLNSTASAHADLAETLTLAGAPGEGEKALQIALRMYERKGNLAGVASTHALAGRLA
jgi:class 3 adenylate cyclase/tetratricopeptide (TPR) repeat protein